VDGLADVVAGLPGVLPWCAPRRLPYAFLRDGTLHRPTGTTELSAAECALLDRCDGRRSAREVAARVTVLGDPALATDEQVYAALARMRAEGLIVWAFELPFQTHPDRALEACVEAIDDEPVRDKATRLLRTYRSAVDRVRDAAGAIEPLDAAIDRLETVFARLTGKTAVRGHGRMYAARTLVHEHTVRDVDVRLGPQIRDELGPPLGLVLRSARWLTVRMGDRVREEVGRIHAELRAGSASSAVPAARLWYELPRLFPALGADQYRETPLLTELAGELRQRWLDVLDIADASVSRVQRSTADIAEAANRAFPADRPGWRIARHHSPDVLLCATDEEAVNRGDYRLVLGEMHLANNTLVASLFADNHPEPVRLRQRYAADLPEGVVVTVAPRHWRGITSSTRNAVTVPSDWHLLMSEEFVSDPRIPAEHQLAMGELVVQDVDGRLVARTYDNRYRADILDFLGELLSVTVVDSLSLAATGRHTPRIAIDRLVVQREAWRVPLAEVGPLLAGQDEDRFVALRAWARGLGMPERVFFAVPFEDKPVFVDLSSPVLVAIAVKALRRAMDRDPDKHCTVSEMSPDLGDLWLADAAGRRFTSELRTVVVDRSG
jgi:hypothetical protein